MSCSHCLFAFVSSSAASSLPYLCGFCHSFFHHFSLINLNFYNKRLTINVINLALKVFWAEISWHLRPIDVTWAYLLAFPPCSFKSVIKSV